MGNNDFVRLLLTKHWANYPDESFDVDQFRSSFSHYDAELVYMACEWLATQTQFFPTESQIHDAVVTLIMYGQGIKDASTAWADVLNEKRKQYNLPKDRRPEEPNLAHMTKLAALRIGWREIMEATEAQEPFLFKRFEKVYGQNLTAVKDYIKAPPAIKAVLANGQKELLLPVKQLLLGG